MLWFCVCVQWRARGGGWGARAPAPLRSDAKVPLRPGLCDMNDTICSVCCLCRAPSQLLKKINKYVTRHARARDRRSHLMFAAEAYDHNWTTITPPQRKTKHARHFQVGYIHNQRTIYIRQYFFVLIKTDQSNWAPETPFKMSMKIRTRQTHASLVLEYNTDCKNSKYNTLKKDQQHAPNEPFTSLCVIWSRAALMLHSRAFTLTSYSKTTIKSNHRPTAYNKSMVHFLKGFVFYVFIL